MSRADPNDHQDKESTPSAKGGLSFSLSSGKGKKQQRNPDYPVNPVKENKPLAEKTIEDVLLHFGDTLKVARKRYRQFIKNGIVQGGGLIRSSGGNKSGLLGRKKEDRELSDERVLGSGDFACPVQCEAISLGWRRFWRRPMNLKKEE